MQLLSNPALKESTSSLIMLVSLPIVFELITVLFLVKLENKNTYRDSIKSKIQMMPNVIAPITQTLHHILFCRTYSANACS